MMQGSVPRVAFFADSFHEVNGVANTSRQLDAFARRRDLPLLSVHAAANADLRREGSVTTLELDRGNAAFKVERDMSFDPLMMQRHRHWTRSIVRAFRPDVVHITGPSDIGILGAWIAHDFRLPLVASWHTNLHEFGARRLDKLISFVPSGVRDPVTNATEHGILTACARFYRMANVLMAPNDELVDMLVRRTGRPAYLMQRGVDTQLFSPSRRTRADAAFVYGYVGRITSEKNVRLLADVERTLITSGITEYRFSIVGHGGELDWLRANLRQAGFPGVLKGEALAQAYANMDAFLFPSNTDTFGNVILEAAASGVPSVVTSSGGPKFLVRDGATGYVASDDHQFITRAVAIAQDRTRHASMRAAARDFALTMSWDAVFEKVYDAYRIAISSARLAS